MGLDMYATKIKQELVGDEQHDIDLCERTLNYSWFKVLTLDEQVTLSKERRQEYDDSSSRAMGSAVENGLYDSDFCYWRKFNHLHGWMERLYRSKGGESDLFNGNNVRLMPADIERLRIEAAALKPQTGFFFGSQDEIDCVRIADVMLFCDKCDAAFKDGYAVFYDSCW